MNKPSESGEESRTKELTAGKIVAPEKKKSQQQRPRNDVRRNEIFTEPFISRAAL